MHTQGQTIEFLEKVFKQSGKKSNGGLNIAFVCPWCKEKDSFLEKQKLVIRTDNFLTHCWVCGYKSRSIFHVLKNFYQDHIDEFFNSFADDDFINSYNKNNEDDNDNNSLFENNSLNIENIKNVISNPELEHYKIVTANNPQITIPDSFRMLVDLIEFPHLSSQTNVALSYLYKKRNITKEDLWFFKIGIVLNQQDVNWKGRVVFPSFDLNGNLNHLVGRSYISGIKKYYIPSIPKKPIIFNEINIDWKKELTLVEGVFDLVKIKNTNSTCLLGSEIDNSYLLYQKIVENKTPVLLALDPDVFIKQIKIAENLLEEDIEVKICDLSNDLGKDIGSMTQEEIGWFKTNKTSQIRNRNDLLRLKLRMNFKK